MLFACSQKNAYRKWSETEDQCLLQYISLNCTVLQDSPTWPTYGEKHIFWREAAQNLAETMGDPLRKGQ
jgi:hypothetical protein